eukprot:gene56910-77992_t
MTIASEPNSAPAQLHDSVFLGRLSLESIPYHEPIILVTFAVAGLLGLALLAWITRARAWGWLWRDWFCTIDHKKIGVMLLRRDHDARPAMAARMTRRIGLLGGSFNPAHQGHRAISLAAIRALGLDEVWWLVSPGNPLKDKARDMAPLAIRLANEWFLGVSLATALAF